MKRMKISSAVLMFTQMDLFSYTEYFAGSTSNNFCSAPVKKVHHKILMLVTLWWCMLRREKCVFFIRPSISVLSNCDICTCVAAEFEVVRNMGKFAHPSACVLRSVVFLLFVCFAITVLGDNMITSKYKVYTFFCDIRYFLLGKR